ncbi:unnamed protein product [Schistosoma mattheei]|uniref:Uncharacterized protein n=1 Tax=Schistosoma mattheei TaxID=31246 RepID=A0A183PDV0_9TREM|nr:unnamed protein product [Schistosoma mattheei]
MEEEIRKKCWKWIGHTLRKASNCITRRALNLESSRPKEKRRIEEHIAPRNGDMRRMNKNWIEVERKAQDRVEVVNRKHWT